MQNAKEIPNLCLRQGGGWLVENEEPRLPREGARDLDHLLLGRTQATDLAARVEGKMQATQQRLGVGVEARPIDDSRCQIWLSAQVDIAPHVECGHQGELLVDHRDSEALGLDRRSDRDWPS